MPPKRTPGPECAASDNRNTKDGTLCRQPSPIPSPTGTADDSGFASWASKKASATGTFVYGHLKSSALTVMDLLPLRPDAPYATVLIKHYVEGSGELYEFDEIPKEWRDWIVKATKGRPGMHRELNPYNEKTLYDLRHALGHFDVEVKRNVDGTSTYLISDTYKFGFKPNDRKQEGRHGFSIGQPSKIKLELIKMALPSDEYWNPGGFRERWEVRKINGEMILYIPQQFLANEGKEFPVRGSFTQ